MSPAVPLVLMLDHHPSRDGDIRSDPTIHFSPAVEARDYFDSFGNICTRLVAPPGLLEVRSEFVIEDSGLPDEVCPTAKQWDIDQLPSECLPFLLGSRYCDTERLSDLAWSLFGNIRAAGNGRRRSATTRTTVLNSAITTPVATAPPRRDMTSVAASVGTSPISRDAVPLHEYTGALLHGLSWRYRRASRSGADGFQRMV